MTHAQHPAELPGKDPGARRLRFSVVIPAYNEAEFLGNCLDSILQQDFAGPYEVIVVDNNSSDGTTDIARARGVTVVHESRPGVCWARQSGTALAEGEPARAASWPLHGGGEFTPGPSSIS